MSHPDDDPNVAFIGGRKGMMVYAALCILLGPFVGVWALGDMYGFAGGVLAGLIGGAGTAMIPLTNRMLE